MSRLKEVRGSRFTLRTVKWNRTAHKRLQRELDEVVLHGEPKPEAAQWMRTMRPSADRIVQIDHQYFQVELDRSVSLYWLRDDGYWYRLIS